MHCDMHSQGNGLEKQVIYCYCYGSIYDKYYASCKMQYLAEEKHNGTIWKQKIHFIELYKYNIQVHLITHLNH